MRPGRFSFFRARNGCRRRRRADASPTACAATSVEMFHALRARTELRKAKERTVTKR
jgi:hypothetical protein